MIGWFRRHWGFVQCLIVLSSWIVSVPIIAMVVGQPWQLISLFVWFIPTWVALFVFPIIMEWRDHKAGKYLGNPLSGFIFMCQAIKCSLS